MAAKSALVWLLLGCASLSSARLLPAKSGGSLDIQRLFKFSGIFAASPSVRGWLGVYNEPEGAASYWEKTQNVRLDAQEHYSLLPDERALGGLPAEIFTSHLGQGLGVQPYGQPEPLRVVPAELRSAGEPDSRTTSTRPIEAAGILPTNRSERRLALVLLIMFLLGVVLAYGEFVKWWKQRAEQFGEPPFANLLNSVPSSAEFRRIAQTIRFPLLNRLHGRSQNAIPSGDDKPKKAA